MKHLGKSSLLTIALLVAAGAPSVAHGPTPQKVEETVTIAAPPDKVWAKVKDFDQLAAWNPAVTSSKGKGGNEAGAEREVELKAGGKLVDSLDEYLANEMNYSYRLETPDIEHFPVSFYSATLAVHPGKDGGSEVEWDARFYRADTGNFPAEDQNDQAAIDAITKFFKDGLDNLKKAVETPSG